MLTAIKESGSERVQARHVSRDEGPFRCPTCDGEAILRKGKVRIHHFAHKADSDCIYGSGESEAHRKCKQEIYDELIQIPHLDCEMEKPLDGIRPDILIFSAKRKLFYGIEVQISNLTMDTIIERTKRYHQQRIYVLWLPLFNPELETERYAPRAWERWLHTLNFGAVYYWMSGLEIAKVKFDTYHMWVEHSEFYASGGELRQFGGYHKESKRWRKPVIQKTLSLAGSFKPQRRKAWSAGEITIPAARILIDGTRD